MKNLFHQKRLKKGMWTIAFACFAPLSYAQTFTTTEIQASDLDDSQIVSAAIESDMDDNGNIHIAWVRDVNGVQTVMYSFYESSTSNVTTVEVDPNFSADRKIIGNITTNNNKPYIAYFCKRDDNLGFSDFDNTGNYAVMLASDPEGDNSFAVEQVSNNPIDPLTDTDDPYSCDVDGRPNVNFVGGNLMVSYASYDGTATSWDNYMIFATRSGSAWNRVQEYNINDLTGGYLLEHGMSVTNNGGSTYAGFIETANYSVRYNYKSGSNWSEIEVGNYSGTYANDHIQLVNDNSSNTHLFWYNDNNDQFCHTIINGSNYSTVIETPIQESSASGNFKPATIDKTLGTPVYFYGRSFGDDKIILLDDQNVASEVAITQNIGKPLGRKNIFANNGKVYLVTGSESNEKIYVTTNDSSAPASVGKIDNDFIEVYPNPATDVITIDFGNKTTTTISFMNNLGQVVATHQVENQSKLELSTRDFARGVYFVNIALDNNTVNERIVLSE